MGGMGGGVQIDPEMREYIHLVHLNRFTNSVP